MQSPTGGTWKHQQTIQEQSNNARTLFGRSPLFEAKLLCKFDVAPERQLRVPINKPLNNQN
jgi:hypothetical protein